MVTRKRPVKKAVAEVPALEEVSNDAADQIMEKAPYSVLVRIEGTTPILFHRWSVESVAEKAASAKGSTTKKTDDLESYVYRNEAGEICLPVEYVRQSIIQAAKYKQDPRSARKSAMDLYKAAITAEDELATLGARSWDYVDQRRVTIQRSGITRQRPAFEAGWQAQFRLMVLLPEYVPPMILQQVLSEAGRLVGVGDFRPSYGRFVVTKFETVDLV